MTGSSFQRARSPSQPNAANQHPANRRGGDASEQSNLEEDRLLLAGLRSNKSGIDETGAGARSTGRTGKAKLVASPAFRRVIRLDV